MSAYCSKCGNEIPAESKFCLKCGQPVNLSSNKNYGPKAPQPPRQFSPGVPRPQAPVQNKFTGFPQPPRPMAPGKPEVPRPGMPTAPFSQGMENKGFFTNAVRSVANAMTGGALNRDIEHEQRQAVNNYAREVAGEIKDERELRVQAERERIAAEREAERTRDRRSMEAVEGIEVVRGRAIWNIQPGEIARKIKETELEEIEKLKGIIVQEGCTALIFANGELVTTLSSGAYLFYKSVEEEEAALKKAVEEAEKKLQEEERRRLQQSRTMNPSFRQLGIVGEIGRAGRWVARLIFGEKKSEQKDKIKRRELDYARILARLTQVPVMSVYIVSNRNIPMTFGGKLNQDGQLEFSPYIIPMGIHDVEIGVSLIMRVNDIHQLATNYLADQSNFTTTQLHKVVSPIVENVLKESLRNQEYSMGGLSSDLVVHLKERIRQAIDSYVFGLECSGVTNISDNNADFERFRKVDHELYNTEKELDYMQRTGEFRNRLEIEANSQEISRAKNAEELRYALQKLNRDGLLHDDEMQDFVSMLESQRRIKDATTSEQEFEALEDLRKNRLVKQDEMEALEDALAHKKIPRNEITELIRVQSQMNIDKARQTAEWALEDSHTDHEWAREDLERRRNWGIEDEEYEREWMRDQREYDKNHNRIKAQDEYDFAKMLRTRELEKEDRLMARNELLEDRAWEYQKERRRMLDEDQIEANRHQRNVEKLQAMAEMQAKLDAQKLKHEENIASIKSNEQINRDTLFAGMNAEQIRAAQLSHLSEDAQVAMANALSGQKEAEAMRQAHFEKEQMMQQMLRMQQDSSSAQMEAMMKMAGMIKDTASGVSSSFQSLQQQRIDKLENENQRQQDRLEKTQDAAMSHLAEVSTAAAGNINAFNGGARGNVAQTSGTRAQNVDTPSQSPAEVIIECQCYNCGHNIKIAVGAPACPDCGAPFQW